MVETNRQARAEATKLQLVQAASGVFADRGYRGATVAAITERAETAHGTFYLYFKNREDVFLHVITDMLDELYQQSFIPIEELPAQRDPLTVRERIAAFLVVCARYGPLWRAVLEGVLASPAIEAHWLDHRRRFLGTLADRIRYFRGDDRGRDLDVDVAAYALASMIEWYAITGAVFEEPQPLVASDAVVDTIAGLWFRALGPDA